MLLLKIERWTPNLMYLGAWDLVSLSLMGYKPNSHYLNYVELLLICRVITAGVSSDEVSFAPKYNCKSSIFDMDSQPIKALEISTSEGYSTRFRVSGLGLRV